MISIFALQSQGITMSSASGSTGDTSSDEVYDDIVSVSFKTSGLYKVWAGLIAQSNGHIIAEAGSTSGGFEWRFLRDATDIASGSCLYSHAGANIYYPPSAFWTIHDAPTAGTYTYKFQLKPTGGSNAGYGQQNFKLGVFEIKF